jgi:hypothetical protein
VRWLAFLIVVVSWSSLALAAAPDRSASPPFRPNGRTEPPYPQFDRPKPTRVAPVGQDGYRLVVRLLDDEVNPWAQRIRTDPDLHAGWLGARVTLAPGTSLPGLVLPEGDVDVSGGLLLLRGERPIAQLVGAQATLLVQLLDARGNFMGTPIAAEIVAPTRSAAGAVPGATSRTWIVYAVVLALAVGAGGLALSRRSASRP